MLRIRLITACGCIAEQVWLDPRAPMEIHVPLTNWPLPHFYSEVANVATLRKRTFSLVEERNGVFEYREVNP